MGGSGQMAFSAAGPARISPLGQLVSDHRNRLPIRVWRDISTGRVGLARPQCESELGYRKGRVGETCAIHRWEPSPGAGKGHTKPGHELSGLETGFLDSAPTFTNSQSCSAGAKTSLSLLVASGQAGYDRKSPIKSPFDVARRIPECIS
jgi:hypothetical protein